MPAGQPLKYRSVTALIKMMDDYFDDCDIKKIPYTITGLCQSIGTTRKTLCEYEKRDKYVNAIKKAKARVEQYVETLMLSGKAQPGTIFWMKNHGWQDRQQVDVNDVTDLSEDQLRAKLSHIMAKK